MASGSRPPPHEAGHVPVLARPALEWLRVEPGGIYVDCTVGLGGHATLIAEGLDTGRLVGLDRDTSSVEMARARLQPYRNVTVVNRNYGELRMVLDELGIERVNGVLIDAGLSSMQLDDPERGFSFQEQGLLDMRMDTSTGLTAREYLATVSGTELARVLKVYGDVRPARRIAAAIVRRREGAGLNTTRDLAQAVADALPFVTGVPAETRTVFQAIRIAVNDELRWLDAGLRQAIDVLIAGGRLVVITFHSGEDRVAKNVLREASRPHQDLYPDGRVRAVQPARLKVLTPKPVEPDEAELRENPRARSAKLRAAERLNEGGPRP